MTADIYDDYHHLLAERDELKKEVEAQARLNGMGAERELALIAERDSLKKELMEWKELHARHSALVIPGETDSADAYRRMWFEMKARLKPTEDALWVHRVRSFVGRNE